MDFNQLTHRYLSQVEYSKTLYYCTEGSLRIGAGRNIERDGLSDEEIFLITKNDLARCTAVLLDRIQAFGRLGVAVQTLWVRIARDMGIELLFEDQELVDLLCAQCWAEAAEHLSRTFWARKYTNMSSSLVTSLMRLAPVEKDPFAGLYDQGDEDDPDEEEEVA